MSPVRHIVAFQYATDTQATQIEQITQAFANLPQQIPGIIGFEHGVNTSPEGKNLGFTHIYTLTFESAAARDHYLPHPAHQAFGQLLQQLGVVTNVFVVDYQPTTVV